MELIFQSLRVPKPVYDSFNLSEIGKMNNQVSDNFYSLESLTRKKITYLDRV